MTILGDMMITVSVFPYLSPQRAEAALRVKTCAIAGGEATSYPYDAPL